MFDLKERIVPIEFYQKNCLDCSKYFSSEGLTKMKRQAKSKSGLSVSVKMSLSENVHQRKVKGDNKIINRESVTQKYTLKK